VVYLSQNEGAFFTCGTLGYLEKPDGSILDSFSIITLPPNDFMRPIHDRIPAILHPDDEETWLNCTGNPFEKVEPLLVPFPSE
jgi:putative SOS response-associated peptidase YedK